MRRKWIGISSALMLVSLLAVPEAFANGSEQCPFGSGGFMRERGHFHGGADRVLRLKEDLGLTDEQTQAIRQIKTDAKKSLIRQRAEREVAEIDLRSKIKETNADDASVNELIDRVYDLKKVEAKTLLGTHAKILKVLDESQREKLLALKKEGMKKYGHAPRGPLEFREGITDEADEG